METRIGAAALRVVGVDDRVDDCLAYRRRGQAPAIPAAYPPDDGAPHGVLLDEGHRLPDRLHKVRLEPLVIKNGCLVRAGETAGVDPGIREAVEPVPSEKEHASDGGDQPAPVPGQKSEGLQVGAPQSADRCKGLGSLSEV